MDWVVSVQQEGGQRVYFSYFLHESSPRGSKLCGDRSVLGNPSWVGKLECIRVKASLDLGASISESLISEWLFW